MHSSVVPPASADAHRSYAPLAGEYYDADRHPTAALFRKASHILLERGLLGRVEAGALVVEVGAGQTVLPDFFPPREYQLVATDSVREMMAGRDAGVHSVVADARQLPFRDGSTGLVVAILGDPYNGPAFWSEVGRVLRRSGCVVFTTPSAEWARPHRARGQDALDEAVFVNAWGRRIRTPSVVLDPTEQRVLMRAAGFRVERFDTLTRDSLGDRTTLPNGLAALGPRVPIIYGYRAVRE